MEAIDSSAFLRLDTAPEGRSRRPYVGFLFIGGSHHMLHLAPVAVELARQGRVHVRLFAGSKEDAARLRGVVAKLGALLPIEELPTPSWAWMLPRFNPGWSALKLPRLYAGRRRLAEMDLLVTAERTSTMLKRLPGRAPLLVHIPHGAGDRARGFEPRLKLFDHVIVAGHKDRERMIDAGLVRAEACSVSGYVKLSAVLATRRRRPAAERLFENDRPTILYNPHFANGLSSWAAFGETLVRGVRASGRYNLIVAPHVRLAAELTAAERARIEALAEPGRILIDLGSERSNDMSYTLAADLYVGDVSSQVYEFLHRPRPCLFLNATGTDPRDDPNFAMWRLGEVIDTPAALPEAFDRAFASHAGYAGLQAAAVRRALGPIEGDAVAEAARIIDALAVGGEGSVAEAA